jgi:hypothetical protein
MHRFKNIYNFFFYCYTLLLAGTSPAAFEFIGVGAEPLALGNAMVAYRDNAYAVYYNPAYITAGRKPLIELGYRSFYGLTFPRQASVLVQFPVRTVPISVCCIHLGDRIYREMHLALGSSYTYHEKLSMGISLNLYYLNIAAYSNSLSSGINLGFAYPLSDRFTMGVLITNLNQPKFSIINEKLPQIFTLGCCYNLHQNIIFCCDLFRDVKYEQDYRAGVSVKIKPEFTLRFGLEDKSNTCTMGLGLTLKRLKFDYTAILHNTLGLSLATSIQLAL